jgi:uncharacterized protein (DUF433 family)
MRRGKARLKRLGPHVSQNQHVAAEYEERRPDPESGLLLEAGPSRWLDTVIALLETVSYPEAGCDLPMADLRTIIHSDPEIHSGDPVFVGTRVPVRTLLDYIEGGDSLDVFLDNFPSVTREQAVAFLEEAGRAALAQIA